MEENQALPWSGLRDAKPKRREESGVGGDRAPSDLVFVECRGRKIEGAKRDRGREACLTLHSLPVGIILWGTSPWVGEVNDELTPGNIASVLIARRS